MLESGPIEKSKKPWKIQSLDFFAWFHGLTRYFNEASLLNFPGKFNQNPKRQISPKKGQNLCNSGVLPLQSSALEPRDKPETGIYMPEVKLKENEPFDVALRRFKRSCEKAGILAEVRRREFYEKPTSVRKRKAAAAVKRHAKKVSRETRRTQRLY